MSEPLISVIVPIYNVEKYLDKCVESIINQTYKNLEIILVDDGSPDNCPQICDDWAIKDSRIRVVHKQNGGQGSARNAGLDCAAGDYIGFIDGDDFVDADFYECLLNNALKNDADICCCNFNYTNSDGISSEGGFQYISKEKAFSRDELLDEYFASCKGQWVSFCNKIIKKDVFAGLRFPEKRLFEDWTLAPMVYYNCDKAFYIPLKKYNYVIHDSSAVRTHTLKRYADCVKADYDHYIFFNDKNIDDYNNQIKSFMSSDLKKCIKAYSSSKEKPMLKETYDLCNKIISNKKLDLLFKLPSLFHTLYVIKEKIK